jgi:hypothetical protein
MDQQSVPAELAEEISTWIPDGFVRIVARDGEDCIVPEFLIPAAKHAFAAYRKRGELHVCGEAGGVNTTFYHRNLFTCRRRHRRFVWPVPVPRVIFLHLTVSLLFYILKIS